MEKFQIWLNFFETPENQGCDARHRTTKFCNEYFYTSGGIPIKTWMIELNLIGLENRELQHPENSKKNVFWFVLDVGITERHVPINLVSIWPVYSSPAKNNMEDCENYLILNKWWTRLFFSINNFFNRFQSFLQFFRLLCGRPRVFSHFCEK